MLKNRKMLKEKLDKLCEDYHASFLYSDPLKYLHLYKKPEDQEIVGMIASSLAYGRVERIFKSVEAVLAIMGNSPSDYVKRFNPALDSESFNGFIHRFNKGEDIACLIWFMKQTIDAYGSIGALFGTLFQEDDKNIGDALAAFVAKLLSLDSSPFYGGGSLPKNAGVRYFFPSPEKGSACKRLSLYLRWMVRKDDGLDLGIWDFIPPGKLVIPIDTHIARMSRQLGLTKLKSPGWNMALEITGSLKELDANDPLKYDFALCRLGILDLCPQKRDEAKCAHCDISEICMI
ncbi:MAG: TIGR02757 family protein [bacterium]|nr:TIGR02757 family protein [bacterium]